LTLARIRAIDDLRSAAIVLVVAHHAAMAYARSAVFNPHDVMASTTPVVDPQRWWFFDLLLGWNDLFFMAVLFLLSGLFVPAALQRRGAGGFLQERWRRLGLPFLAAAGVLSPLAFYPAFLQARSAGATADAMPLAPLAYWLAVIRSDAWSPGPAWFLWLLLAYSTLAALAWALLPPLRRWRWCPRSPMTLLAISLACSNLSSTAMALVVGPGSWFRLAGPLAAQSSRLLLYGTWFGLGLGLGAADPEQSLGARQLRPWRWWLLTGMLLALLHLVLLGDPASRSALPPLRLRLALAMTSASAGCCLLLASLGWARRWLGRPSPLSASLRRNAFGIYLLHYPLVTWSQWGLQGVALGAVTKAGLCFVVALTGSWGLSALLRFSCGCAAAARGAGRSARRNRG
jgi:glucan biosynthesis protein C